jgi:hypothetical protein
MKSEQLQCYWLLAAGYLLQEAIYYLLFAIGCSLLAVSFVEAFDPPPGIL